MIRSVCVAALCGPWMVALAQAQAFSFEGFALGMPRAKAMELKTDAPWRLAAVEGQGDVIRKEFAARQHDRDVTVAVDLDSRREVVHAITFTYPTATTSACVSDGLQALQRLEKTYGKQYEAINGPPSMRARWTSAPGLEVRWAEWCDVGGRRYSVSYSRPGG